MLSAKRTTRDDVERTEADKRPRIQSAASLSAPLLLKAVVDGNLDELHKLKLNPDHNPSINTGLLHIAVWHNQPAVLDFFREFSEEFSQPLNSNNYDKQSLTPLCLAIFLKQEHCVAALLRYPTVDINKTAGKERLSPLEMAIQSGNLNIVIQLLNDERPKIVKQWSTLFYRALELKHMDIYQALIRWHNHYANPSIDWFGSETLPIDINSIRLGEASDRIFDSILPIQEILPAGLEQFTDEYLYYAMQGHHDALQHLNQHPTYLLINWFAKNQNTKLNRLSLSLAHFRYLAAHPGENMMLTELTEDCILSAMPKETIEKYESDGYTRILSWLNWVCDTPEAFMYHEKYLKIRQIIEPYRDSSLRSQTPSETESLPLKSVRSTSYYLPHSFFSLSLHPHPEDDAPLTRRTGPT